MYKVSQFITMSEKEYNRAGISVNETVEVTLAGHLLFDMDTRIPVIVRDVSCIGYAEVNSITLTRNGSTAVEFVLKGMSEKSAESAYILYNNQAASSNDSKETRVPGLYRSRTTGPANNRRFNGDDDDLGLPQYLRD